MNKFFEKLSKATSDPIFKLEVLTTFPCSKTTISLLPPPISVRIPLFESIPAPKKDNFASSSPLINSISIPTSVLTLSIISRLLEEFLIDAVAIAKVFEISSKFDIKFLNSFNVLISF